MKDLWKYLIFLFLTVLLFRFLGLVIWLIIRFWYVFLVLGLILYFDNKAKQKRKSPPPGKLDPDKEIKLDNEPTIEEEDNHSSS